MISKLLTFPIIGKLYEIFSAHVENVFLKKKIAEQEAEKIVLLKELRRIKRRENASKNKPT